MRNWPALALLGGIVGLAAGPAQAAPGREDPVIIPTEPLPGAGTALHGTIGGRDGLFLFDTGAGVTTVTPAVAARSGCRPWGRVTGFRATGERIDTPRCDDLRITLGGRRFTAPIALVFDLQRLTDPHMPALSGFVALDLFAGQTITIRPLAHQLVVETASSLRQRIRDAAEVPVRLVRDVEGVALTVDAAVDTPAGRAWMELDIGNLGPLMIGGHVASLLHLDPARTDRQTAAFALAGGVPVRGPARVGDLIMDGDVGESVLGAWDITLDLKQGRAWFRPASG